MVNGGLMERAVQFSFQSRTQEGFFKPEWEI